MSKTILVIDDNNDIRENTAEILELAGYKTYTAENGKRGVELATKERPSVIVCDIMMPELDGYGVLHLLRKIRIHKISLSSSLQLRQSAVIFVRAWRWVPMIISPNPLMI